MTPEERAEGITKHLENPNFLGYTILMPIDVIKNAISAMIADAIKEEREMCAETAEATCTWVHDKPYEVQLDMRARIAAGIRARGETS